MRTGYTHPHTIVCAEPHRDVIEFSLATLRHHGRVCAPADQEPHEDHFLSLGSLNFSGVGFFRSLVRPRNDLPGKGLSKSSRSRREPTQASKMRRLLHKKPDPEEQAKEWRRSINHEASRAGLFSSGWDTLLGEQLG